jgi:glycosyltransferase involved in cell wall biosynthesis
MHLVAVGGGELRDDLARHAEGAGLAARVHWVGARRDLGNLLAAMDMFVMPSLWEGLPLSLVLAMGAGVPVVATAIAGIPEVVQDGRSGLLVPPGDPVALGAALARLADDPVLRARMGREGRASVLPRFGVDRYVDAIVGLYDELLEKVA